ncbi:MAG: efflux RND transporter periplasmic adaptor subunit, partial [Gammaproteobacteria bacterium]|nr:efflux RND transporter periplasmic adaptor subunit [Gammaproteobacteria bacterium]
QQEQTRYQIQRSRITAPFSGRVTERHANIGEFIVTGGPVARLIDTGNVEVRAQAPVAVARYLDDGMAVSVRDDRGTSPSQIRSVIGVGDERSRMVEVRIALEGTDWIIGSAVRVELPQSEPTTVVAVPRDALILRENATYLYKVKDDNTVEQIPVRTGIGNGARIEVQGDIADGDRIVIRGGERLRPGQSVVIQDS